MSDTALVFQALQCNNEPSRDHGVEVLYRFADFDPFARCWYFGCALLVQQRRTFFGHCLAR